MWRDAYLENRVLSADPVELIYMLYERAISLVASARASLKAGDVAARSKAISQTVAILSELEGSLNHEAGGEISRNLNRLYQYMRTRLMTANLKQEEAPLTEVEALLQTLGKAWQRIKPQVPASAGDPPAAEAARGRWGTGSPAEAEPVSAGHSWKA